MVKVKSKFTNEEELLLEDFSRNISGKASLMFYLNALIVSAIPLWLYWKIHMMDPVSSSPLFLVVTAASTYLVAFAYKNTKFVLKHKVAQKMEEAVTKEVLRELSENKKTFNKAEKDERVLWKKNEVADKEATTFSLFYNNAVFLVLVMVGSFVLFRTFSPSYNYALSLLLSSGAVALVSTSTPK